MDTLVLNILPSEIHSKKIIGEYKFDFLEGASRTNEKYYGLLLSLHTFKLGNIYNFLFLRLLKINHMFPKIRKMKINKYIKSYDEFNQELNEYINQETLYAIIIMNGIQQYFIPI